MTDLDSRRAFRDLLGALPAGVCVITTDGPAGRAGMTASSLCSLSLDPLLLLVCLDNRSETLKAIRRNGRFAVNLLAEDQSETSGVFASDRSPEERFTAVDHDLVDGSPVLRQVMGWLTCEVYSTVPTGDHTIVVGEVLDLSRAEGAPLVWHRGGYGLRRGARQNRPQPTHPSDAAHAMDRP